MSRYRFEHRSWLMLTPTMRMDSLIPWLRTMKLRPPIVHVVAIARRCARRPVAAQPKFHHKHLKIRLPGTGGTRHCPICCTFLRHLTRCFDLLSQFANWALHSARVPLRPTFHPGRCVISNPLVCSCVTGPKTVYKRAVRK